MQPELSSVTSSTVERSPVYARTIGRRALIATILIISFYLFRVAVVFGLFALTYAFAHFGLIGLGLAVGTFVSGLVMLVVMLPRYHRFKAPGPRIWPKDQPALFKLISEVAEATDQRMPAEVYLVLEANAAVTERGGILGFGKRRVLYFGLPLLAMLDVSQLRSVIAHEFGHYYGKDTKLSPWLYRTHFAMLEMADGLHQSGYGAWMNLVLLPYIELTLHITLRISRYQEYAADRLAAGIAGTEATASALKLVRVTNDIFNAYWDASVLPLAGMGYLAPVMEGLSRFARAQLISAAMNQRIDIKVEDSRDTRFVEYSTHPALIQRLDALAELDEIEVVRDRRPAISLAVDLPRLEREILTKLIGKKRVDKLKHVEWGDICMQAYYPSWVEAVRADAAGLAGLTPDSLPDVVKNLGVFSVKFLEKSQRWWASDDHAGWHERVSTTLGSALAVALYKAGWTLHATPGEAVRAEREGMVILPFEVLGRLVSRRLASEDWREQCRSAGISGVDLGTLHISELPAQVVAI